MWEPVQNRFGSGSRVLEPVPKLGPVPGTVPSLFPGKIFHAHGVLLPQRAPVERVAERVARDGPADRVPRLHGALRRQG